MEEISYKVPGFEGPLDLLLHLVQKHKIDITDIPIAPLLEQYLETIKKWKELDLGVAVEFLQMAARLVQIKSALLLPKHEEEADPREELTGMLVEYQICKRMAKKLETMNVGDDIYVREPTDIEPAYTYKLIHVSEVLVDAYFMAAGRGMRKLPPPVKAFSALVEREIVPVSRKISHILEYVYSGENIKYTTLFKNAESKSELVATFLAVLELIKDRRIIVEGEGSLQTVKMVSGGRANADDLELEFDDEYN